MIVKSVLLALPPEQAFELFTGRIGEWWPPQNRHLGDPASRLFLQGEGRFFERAGDGREFDLGRVLAWQPPRRIVLDFFVATGPERPTRVEVLFEPEVGGTRVTVRHDPTPASAPLWDERAPRYEAAWERVLAALAGRAAQA